MIWALKILKKIITPQYLVSPGKREPNRKNKLSNSR